MLIENVRPAPAPEMIAQLTQHLRLPTGFADQAAMDARLSEMLETATQVVEERAGRALALRSVVCVKADWDTGGVFKLALGPVAAVETVALVDAAGDRRELAAELWTLETLRGPAHIRARPSGRLPAVPVGGRVEARWAAGYGSRWRDAPEDLRLAVIELAASWFERGESEAAGRSLPRRVASLLEPYRRVRL